MCDAIAEEMRRDPNTLYIGEGIGERGGSFAHTKGLWHEFGDHRVIDTPICELAFTGAAMGAAATGCAAVADLMFADFLFEASSQIINQASKLRYMSNGKISVSLVMRAPMGTIKNAGPHHSGTYHPMWAHCPGLIVVVPSNPADAKGLFKSALRCGDPVVFMEPKSLLATKGLVPAGEHLTPLGVAAVVRAGKDLTLVSCGLMVHRCVEAAERLAEQGVDCEVIDLRTLIPLDVDSITRSVTKTHRLLVVDEAFAMCGIGAEIAAAMMEHAFDELDAPVGRLHTDPVAIPFSPSLEDAIMVSVDKIVAAAQSVIQGRAPIPKRLQVDGAQVPVMTTMAPVPASQARSTPAVVEALEVPAADGLVEITIPNQDLTITEATVRQWLCQVGDEVTAGQPVLEIETDKAVSEVEAPVAGVLVQISAAADVVAKLGQRVGLIEPR